MNEISLDGLDKGAVLAALYNASRPLGLGFLQYDKTSMTAEQGSVLLKECTYFDYLKGRVMKLDLSGNSIDPWGYDRDLGEGAAKKVVDALRRGDSQTIEAMHATGKRKSAEATRKSIARESTINGNVFTLGLADVADPLTKALDKAED